MLSALLLLALSPIGPSIAGPVDDTAPRQIELNGEDRFALLAGLRYRLGGPFVLAGLANAEQTCRATGACVTASSMQRAGIAQGSGPVTTVDALVSATRVGDTPAVAIVALRSGERVSRTAILLTASVYDAERREWQSKEALLDYQTSYPPGQPSTRRLRQWGDSVPAS